MKKYLILTFVVLATVITSTCFVYVMNGQGAYSSFYPRSQGYFNMCNCGNWQSDHNR